MRQDQLIAKYLSGGTKGKASNMEIQGDYFYSYGVSLCKRVGDVFFIESRVNSHWTDRSHWYDIVYALQGVKFISLFRLGNARPDGNFKYEIDRRVDYLVDLADKMKRSRSGTALHIEKFRHMVNELRYFVDSINEVFGLTLTMPEVAPPKPKEKYFWEDTSQKSMERIHNILAGGSLPKATFRSNSKNWRGYFWIYFDGEDRPLVCKDVSEISKLKNHVATEYDTYLAYPLEITEEIRAEIKRAIIKEML